MVFVEKGCQGIIFTHGVRVAGKSLSGAVSQIFGICENMCSHDILAGRTTVCELEGFKWQQDNSGHNF